MAMSVPKMFFQPGVGAPWTQSKQERLEEHWNLLKQLLPEGFVNNPLMVALKHMGATVRLKNIKKEVPALPINTVIIDVNVSPLGLCDLVARFWTEEQVQGSLVQSPAAAASSSTAHSPLIATQVASYHVEGHGMVTLNAYAGEELEKVERCQLNTNKGMQRFMACVLKALDQKYRLAGATAGTSHLLTPYHHDAITACNVVMAQESAWAGYATQKPSMPLYKLVDYGATKPGANQLLEIFSSLSESAADSAVVDTQAAAKSDSLILGLIGVEMTIGCTPWLVASVSKSLEESAAAADGRRGVSFRNMIITIRSYLVAGLGLSREGTAFIQSLMEPNPAHRPTPSEAMRHPWLAEAMEQLDKELRDDQQQHLGQQQDAMRHRQLAATLRQLISSGCSNSDQQQQQQEEQEDDSSEPAHSSMPGSCVFKRANSCQAGDCWPTLDPACESDSADICKQLLQYQQQQHDDAMNALRQRHAAKHKQLSEELAAAKAAKGVAQNALRTCQQQLAATANELSATKQKCFYDREQLRDSREKYSSKLATLKAKFKSQIGCMSQEFAAEKAAKEIEVHQMQAAQQQQLAAAAQDVLDAKEQLQQRHRQNSANKRKYQAKLAAVKNQSEARIVGLLLELAAAKAAKEQAVHDRQAAQQQLAAATQQQLAAAVTLPVAAAEQQTEDIEVQQFEEQPSESAKEQEHGGAGNAMVDAAAVEPGSFSRPLRLSASSSSSSSSVPEPGTPAADDEEADQWQQLRSAAGSDSDVACVGDSNDNTAGSSTSSTSSNNIDSSAVNSSTAGSSTSSTGSSNNSTGSTGGNSSTAGSSTGSNNTAAGNSTSTSSNNVVNKSTDTLAVNSTTAGNSISSTDSNNNNTSSLAVNSSTAGSSTGSTGGNSTTAGNSTSSIGSNNNSTDSLGVNSKSRGNVLVRTARKLASVFKGKQPLAVSCQRSVQNVDSDPDTASDAFKLSATVPGSSSSSSSSSRVSRLPLKSLWKLRSRAADRRHEAMAGPQV